MPCIGRFAPSPTGPLHFGSLLAALASYLDIRARNGRWLLRIEDLDPPREQPGAADSILRTLDAFGLHWDGEVVYQSQRKQLYEEALQQLIVLDTAYPCRCSRKQLRARGVLGYDGHCLRHPPDEHSDIAYRVRHTRADQQFDDRIQGVRRYHWSGHEGDFVVFRRDGLFAYQLAVVVDDAEQGVNEVLRGSDLIDETPHQMELQDQLGYPRPRYAHIPVITNAQGQKLSKQNLAPAIDPRERQTLLLLALQLLGQDPAAELIDASLDELLHWGIQSWRPDAIPARLHLTPDTFPSGHLASTQALLQ
ncbi:tRNA glutamyl-Q(34) synthetase GluQRS [Marinobacterium sediminicola]|uniref:Glutamyl-Q tRNA(Asp) synthetase n=1 Tax=Marinobacterium sediminicola TaxID=518898 RepID=A0ABY1S3Q1_9GAMM|nr:tRNA glutamyl-Q(34) synthetase GluQRS [Marinobacterium sediminicola]ULG68894.1 tRNA glutamyl-Q(34) synthetase GluQRS [Marinobacterium sediminicola]SMR77904.1 glutamyl-Q tRNA(Asp) synthetase [Marinobacterium sediminicola]